MLENLKGKLAGTILLGLIGVLLVTIGTLLIFHNVYGPRLILGSIFNLIGGLSVINAYKNTEAYNKYKLLNREKFLQKQEKVRLEELRARLNLVLEGANISIWEWDIKSTSLTESNKLFELLSFTQEEFGNTVDSWETYIHPEDISETKRIIREYLEGKEMHFTIAHRFLTKSGSFKWLLTVGYAMRDKDGVAYKVLGYHQDITDFKQKEEQLDSANNRFKSVMESSPDGVIICDDEQVIVYANRAAEKMYGYKYNQMSGKNLLTIIPDKYKEAHTLGFQKYLSITPFEPLSRYYELESIDLEGNIFPIDLSLASWLDANNNIYFSATIRNIRKRKSSETHLEFFANVVQSSELAVMTVDNDGIIYYWNDKMEELLGYTSEEVIGQSISKILAHRQPYGDMRDKLKQITNPYVSARIHKTGERIPVAVNSWSIFDKDKNGKGECFVYRNLPEGGLEELAKLADYSEVA